MIDQAKNFMIGLFVVAALSIVTFILLFLNPSVGDESKELRVRFSNIDKITVGTRVTFAGKPVGEVTAIHEAKDVENNRIGRDGVVYAYELELMVDSSVNVFNTDEIAARTSGLLGEKSVAIIPLPPRPGEKLRMISDEVLYATEVGSVEDTFKEFKKLSGKFELTLDAITATLNEVDNQKLWARIATVAQNVGDIAASLNRPEEWSETLANMHVISNNAVQSWPKVDASLDNIKKASANAVVLTDDGKDIVADIKRGRGTIGKLIVNDDLYLRTNALFSKADVIMNDINHYGLLFHSDKGWQRLRARRLNLLTKLSTPQEFRNYFNDEVDQISTSLERVSMILDETECLCPPAMLGDDKQFTKVFAELLRRFKTVEEALNMYNEQLADQAAKVFEFDASCCP